MSRQIELSPEFIKYRESFKTYFREHYSHISYEMTDQELTNWILDSQYLMPVSRLADQFSDYLLSQGLADVQE